MSYLRHMQFVPLESEIQIVESLTSNCNIRFRLDSYNAVEAVMIEGELPTLEMLAPITNLQRLNSIAFENSLTRFDDIFSKEYMCLVSANPGVNSILVNFRKVELGAIECLVSDAPNVVCLRLLCCEIGDEHLVHLQKLKSLERLTLACNPIMSDGAIIRLVELLNLEQLVLDEKRVQIRNKIQQIAKDLELVFLSNSVEKLDQPWPTH